MSAACRHDRFTELFAETHDRLGAAARRMLRDDDDAADVVQEVYLRAWKALPGFRGDSHPVTWLTAILHNTVRTYVGRRPKDDQLSTTGVVEPLDPDPLVHPESWADLHALQADMASALERLSPSLRSVALRELEGLSHEAVARELGISTGAVKVRLHRARRTLRKAIAA